MRMLHGLLLALCLLLAACQEEQTGIAKPNTTACTELDSLFETLADLDSVLMNDEAWPVCRPFLDASLSALSYNQRPQNKECNYLDQRYKPDELRLMFVETLRSRIEADTIPEGIYYLLRMM